MSTAATRRTRASLRLSPATAATTGTTASAMRQPLHQRQTPAQEATAAEGEDAAGTACPICFDSLVRPGGGGRLLRSSWAVERVWLECNHVFCQECLSQHASVAVQEGKTAAMAAGSGSPLECPVHGCKVAISEATLKRLLSPADWEKHLRFTADAAVAADPRLKPCPQRRCNGMARLGAASLALLQASASSSSSSGGTYVEAVCDTCAHPFCAHCAAGAHPGKTCEAVGDEGFFRWKRGRPVKPCPFCSYQVEKRGGCDHIYCVKCRNHWCWRCLKAQASCSCYAHFIPAFAGQPANPLAAYMAPVPNQQPHGWILRFVLVLAITVGLVAGAAKVSFALFPENPGPLYTVFSLAILIIYGHLAANFVAP